MNYVEIDPTNNIAYITRTWSDNVVPLNISSGKLLGGINFIIASSNTTKIECCTNKNEYNHYANGNFFMTEVGTSVTCRNPADTRYEELVEWSSPFLIPENSNSTHGIFNVLSVGPKSPIFKEIPPTPIDELVEVWKSNWNNFIYWILPTSLIIGPTIGWALTRYLNLVDKKRELRHLRVLMDMIDVGYQELYNENKDECIKFLRRKHNEIIKLLKGGIISNSTYHLLNERIDDHFQSLR